MLIRLFPFTFLIAADLTQVPKYMIIDFESNFNTEL